MNQARLLLFTAYSIISIVGGALYVQSVHNIVSYTDADVKLLSAVNLTSIEIPRFIGEEHDYVVNVTFRFDNLATTTIRLRTFDFSLAIDSGQPGSMFESARLSLERIGMAGISPGDVGPLVEPGKSVTYGFNLTVRRWSSEVFALNHTTPDGNYIAKAYDIQMSYGFPGSSLLRTVYLAPFVMEVEPIG